MSVKNKPSIMGALMGAFIGLIYTLYFAYIDYTSNTNIVVFLISNLLYFSLLGFIFAIIFEMISDNKDLEEWHVGAFIGFIAFLIILIITSVRTTGFLCRNLNMNYNCNFSQFFSSMILEGPFPLHLLQVFLILLGIFSGMIIGNKEILGIKGSKK